jgi:penicillin G amidase
MRRWLRIARGAVALVVAAPVMGVLAFGYGPVPPLGRVLDPGRGAWAPAADAAPVRSQTLRLAGLHRTVSVGFTSYGVPTIHAADEHDLYRALGYVEARFRLTQMDLERRLGEGRVAELTGASGLSSDRFELRLGLLRTARREWAATPPASPAARELRGYSAGVNAYLARVRDSGRWPDVFALTGVYPRDWTPVDSLVIQGVLTQELTFTTTPLDYALLEKSLGAAKTMDWFPVTAATPQIPYDPGPYRDRGVTPIAAGAASTVDIAYGGAGRYDSGPATAGDGTVTNAAADASAALLARIGRLPAGQVHQYPDSNAWAANGPEVAGGGAMLAGDPHLVQTLPSVWYQVALSAPGVAVSGVALPGLPGIVIGHDRHIAWSLTDVQNQSTLFYAEQTSRKHPGEYFWHGSWRPVRHVRYTIPVHGGDPVRLTVDVTVHGPIMTRARQTMAVDWMGNVPSPDVAVMNKLSKASDFTEFRAALAGWKAPTQNFVYADDAGHIGAISAGWYPQVAHGDPWLPLSGTGADDITGVIPYPAVPQVYDPPSHLVATPNQRPVGTSYPYYIGTSANFFDPGYRAADIYGYLRGHSAMGTDDFAALQQRVTDRLATRIVPVLLAALRADPPVNSRERAAMRLLAGWHGSMDAGSAAAAVWFTFWADYVSAVFRPWWQATKVPVAADRTGLGYGWRQTSLTEDLEQWTRHDPGNPAFTPPGSATRTAPRVMRTAFASAVTELTGRLGSAPGRWTWGRLHSRHFASLTGAGALGYGPRPAGGDPFTVNAADGYPTSYQGASWRMIVRWTGTGQPVAEGIYPGGQSENPASPWYSNLVADWWDGRYRRMPPAGGPATGPIRWTLRGGS